MEKKYCLSPFLDLSITTLASHPCPCDTWIHPDFGIAKHDVSAKHGSLQLWYHPVFTKFRESIRDGSRNTCLMDLCPRKNMKSIPEINNMDLPEEFKANLINFLQGSTSRYKNLPIYLSLDYDVTCNLKCITCRNQVIALPKKMGDTIFENSVKPLLPYAHWLSITGTGDPFASPHFRELLFYGIDLPSTFRGIGIMTNGILFNENAYNRMPNKNLIKKVHVSVDATCVETYNKIRLGGDWEKLLINLEFLKKLKQLGKIDELNFGFVLQEANYKELPAFIDFAKSYGCNHILLNTPGRFHSGINLKKISAPDEGVPKDLKLKNIPSAYSYKIFMSKIYNIGHTAEAEMLLDY